MSSGSKDLLLLPAVWLIAVCGAAAQSAIFNAPSTDTQNTNTTNISADVPPISLRSAKAGSLLSAPP